jgi:hypothetical protein
MSSRLRKIIETLTVEKGPAAKVELCQAVDRSERTLDRWLKDGVPTAHDAYRLALACGRTKEEALAIAAEECPSEAAREA